MPVRLVRARKGDKTGDEEGEDQQETQHVARDGGFRREAEGHPATLALRQARSRTIRWLPGPCLTSNRPVLRIMSLSFAEP